MAGEQPPGGQLQSQTMVVLPPSRGKATLPYAELTLFLSAAVTLYNNILIIIVVEFLCNILMKHMFSHIIYSTYSIQVCKTVVKFIV